jgi:branched-chain amino acid transport system permease protein
MTTSLEAETALGTATISRVAVLSIADGIERLLAPFGEFVADLISLKPTLLQLLVFGLLIGGVLALAALGLTMIFGVMDIINFAHGAFLLVGMYTVWFVNLEFGINPFLLLPVAVAVLVVLGVLLERSVISPIIEAPQQSQLIATFGIFLIIESLIRLQFGTDPREVQIEYGSIRIGSIVIPHGQLYGLLIALVAMIATWAFLTYTDIGRSIRATAANREGARYTGIDVPRIDSITFGIGAGLAGLAGASIALFQPFSPITGTTYLLDAFIVVILGGLGSFPGAFIGGLIIGLIQVFGGFYFPGTTNRVLIFVLFLLVLLLKPTGLFGGEH